jgi:hypothetical protein
MSIRSWWRGLTSVCWGEHWEKVRACPDKVAAGAEEVRKLVLPQGGTAPAQGPRVNVIAVAIEAARQEERARFHDYIDLLRKQADEERQLERERCLNIVRRYERECDGKVKAGLAERDLYVFGGCLLAGIAAEIEYPELALTREKQRT